MNITLIRLLMVATALCGGALATASEPASTPTAPAAAEPISTAAAPTAPAAPAPATAETKTASAKPAPVPAGYKVKVVDGETRYCRKSTPMGTRFATEVCMTMAQYQEQVRNQNAMRSELTGKQKSYSINN